MARDELLAALGAGGLLAAAAIGQIPAHAVLLNPTAGLGAPQVARSGESLHVVGLTAAPAAGFVHYARSHDGGRTWPIREWPLGYLGPIFGTVGGVGVDGDRLHVVMSAQWVGPHVASSLDGGTTWVAPVRVSAAAGSLLVTPAALHVHGAVVNVVWGRTEAAGDVWANRSTDGGLTWQAQDTQLQAASSDTGNAIPTLVAHGDALHVFWVRRPSSMPSTRYQRSLDGGQTWLPTGPRSILSAAMVRAAGSPDALVVADATGSQLQRSLDHGTTWDSVVAPGMANVVDLAVHGATVLLVGRAGAAVPTQMLLQVSPDGGTTWLAVPYEVPLYRSTQSVVAFATADALFVNFVFANAGLPIGVVIQSDDLGVTWREVAGEAGIGLHAGGDGCLVLAKTGSNGTDVNAWVLEGHTGLGQGSPGTGGLVPVLAGAGLAGLGRTFGLELTAARGGAAGAFFTTFADATSVPIGAATLYLQQPIVTAAFTASGPPGAAGAGAATLPVVVPPSPEFAGFRLLSQGFVVDPAVPDGFCTTRAIETWIR